jgi:peptidyl-prolyl cis-trans isomerase A (cyclophilin A)
MCSCIRFGRSSLALSLSLAVAFLVSAASARAEEGDPNHGTFTLEQATKGLPGPANGPLQAVIETSKGKFTCELFAKQAPVTVANFIGLATGKRAWLDPKTNKWVQKKPLYDGLIFHRVIPGFMIQGGDPQGTGMGNPGYRFQDEFSPDLKFDKPGLLAMANAGPATNGSQFFITDSTPSHLTGRHTIFGQCDPTSLVTEIASVPTGPANRPTDNVVIKKITISHAKAGRGGAAAKAKPADKAGAAATGEKKADKPAAEAVEKSAAPAVPAAPPAGGAQ